jgi:hypothetical protein
MPYVFQPKKSPGLNAVFHFSFTGTGRRESSITIRDCMLDIKEGFGGRPDLNVTADAKTRLGFLAKERSLPPALIRRKIRLEGNPKLLLASGKCFPSADSHNPRCRGRCGRLYRQRAPLGNMRAV